MLKNLTNMVTRSFGKMTLGYERHKPEIFLGIGILAFGATIISSSRATLKVSEVLDHHKADMDNIRHGCEIDKEYQIQYAQKDKVLAYLSTAGELVRLYAPSILLGAISLHFIIKSHNTLNDRYLGAVAGYNAVSEAFKAYRGRVIEELGAEADEHYRHGTKHVEVNGSENENYVKSYVDTKNFKPGDGCVIFDESCRGWDPDPVFRLNFLRGCEDYFNGSLNGKGYVFLNEVYSYLGYDPTQFGGISGWIKRDKGDYISFGLDDYLHRDDVRKFVNGKTDSVLLDFNIDGIIIDKLLEKEARPQNKGGLYL